jgi:hypothetical protein
MIRDEEAVSQLSESSGGAGSTEWAEAMEDSDK